MKKIFFLFLFFLYSSNCFAFSQQLICFNDDLDFLWNTSCDDCGIIQNMLFNNQGNIIILFHDISVVSYTPDGEEIWKVSENDNDYDLRAEDMVIDSEDNIIVLGTLLGGGDDNKAIIYKYSEDGELLWSKMIGNNFGGHVTVDDEDNLIVTKRISNYSNETDYDVILKYDGDGNLIWKTSLLDQFKKETFITDIIYENSKIIVVGMLHVFTNSFIAAYNDEGMLEWQDVSMMTYVGDPYDPSARWIYINNVETDGEYVYYAGTIGTKEGGGLHHIIIKYDFQGVEYWRNEEQYGYVNAVGLDVSNNIVIVGSSDIYRYEDSDINVNKYSASGKRLWNQSYKTDYTSRGTDVNISIDNDILLTGFECRENYSYQYPSDCNIIVLKIDENGEQTASYSFTYQQEGIILETKILVNEEGNIYLAGLTEIEGVSDEDDEEDDFACGCGQ